MKQLSAEYLEYVQSREWHVRRALKLLLVGALTGRVQCGYCELFFPPSRVDVHHKSYENFRAEPMSDLLILCRQCHDDVWEIERIAEGGDISQISESLLCRLAVIDSRLAQVPVTVGPTQWMPRPEYSDVTLGEVIELFTRKRREAGLPI